MNKEQLEKDLIDLLDVDYESEFVDDDGEREMPGISLYQYYKDKEIKEKGERKSEVGFSSFQRWGFSGRWRRLKKY